MNVKLIAAAVGGAAYGAAMAWAITSDFYERRLRDLAEDAYLRNSGLRQQVRALGEELMETRGNEMQLEERLHAYESVEPPKNATKDLPDQPEPLEGVIVVSDSEISPGGESDETKVTDDADGTDDLEEFGPIEVDDQQENRLRDIINRYTDLEALESSAPDPLAAQNQYINEKEPPEVISRTEFSHPQQVGTPYDPITVKYFRDHRVVLDDNDEVMEDVGNTLDWRLLTQFGGESGDPDVVFIRNHRLQADFEVVRAEPDEELPEHVAFGMGKEEYRISKAAGLIKPPSQGRGA